MLNRIEWDKSKVQADFCSLESLIAWLGTKRANVRYDYDSCRGDCLYGLYAASFGFSWEDSGACGSYLSTPERNEFCTTVYGDIAAPLPWTFGAALDRARKLASSAVRP